MIIQFLALPQGMFRLWLAVTLLYNLWRGREERKGGGGKGGEGEGRERGGEGRGERGEERGGEGEGRERGGPE